jgi:2-polyprenyl-6-hydroxyphenyl methylase/3-demethylubiquinone-9 3-methyltransferase
VIANAFYPMIKCHLPQNFHFRYTFNIFAKIMGLKVIGRLEGSHATIFKKTKKVEPSWMLLRISEKLSKGVFPFIETVKPILRPIKRLVIK